MDTHELFDQVNQNGFSALGFPAAKTNPWRTLHDIPKPGFKLPTLYVCHYCGIGC